MRRRALLHIVGTATTAALAGCSGNLIDGRTDATTDPRTGSNEANETATPTTVTPDAASSLELDGHDLVRTNKGAENELVMVAGTLVNRGESTAETVAVTVTFLDADGNALDQSRADLTDFTAGETWSFELTYAGVGEESHAVADYTLDVETDEATD